MSIDNDIELLVMLRDIFSIVVDDIDVDRCELALVKEESLSSIEEVRWWLEVCFKLLIACLNEARSIAHSDDQNRDVSIDWLRDRCRDVDFTKDDRNIDLATKAANALVWLRTILSYWWSISRNSLIWYTSTAILRSISVEEVNLNVRRRLRVVRDCWRIQTVMRVLKSFADNEVELLRLWAARERTNISEMKELINLMQWLAVYNVKVMRDDNDWCYQIARSKSI